ncbi:coiled-coil domain-containing protein 186-like [Chironomus tepperi]|uniref:coiled-coil domain-containing protein 186-like n=1 Tax=Chironomus tepperi TaxID=113505 RepID=UPI00391F4C38
MKLIISIVVILSLLSSINCDEEELQKQENLRKFLIDLQYYENVLKIVKNAENRAKEFYENAQHEYEELVVGINNLKNHLKSFLAELTKVDEAHTAAFQNKDKAHTAAALAKENFEKAKEKLDSAKKSGDQEKIDAATSEYTLHSREQLLSADILKKAEEALDKQIDELEDIKMTVKTAQEAYDKALQQKDDLEMRLTQLKSYFHEQIAERKKAEDAYNKVKALVDKLKTGLGVSGLDDGKNEAVSFGIEQIVVFFYSLLTGAVAVGLIL